MALDEYYQLTRRFQWPTWGRGTARTEPGPPDSGGPKWRRWLLWSMLLGLGSLLALVISVRLGAFGKLPSEQDLQQIQHATASELYAEDGTLLGKYYIENRTNTSFDELPQHLIDALIATEDVRFYEHAGVDLRSLGRVLFKSLLMQDRSSGGGSTITQQLAKNLYPREDWGLLSLPVSKIKEMLIAARLERAYGNKQAILTLYLNTVPFGESVFGIGAAARRFFNKRPSDLLAEESAVLIGMLKATTYYNPRNHPDRATTRRNVVLQQMAHYQYLSPYRADSLQALPLTLDYVNVATTVGKAPYFRQEVARYLKKWLADYNDAKGTHYNLYTDGLRVHTTLDPVMQTYAEEAVQTHMKALQQTFDKHWGKRTLWKEDDPGLKRALRQSTRYRLLSARGMSENEIMAVFAQPVKMRIWTWEGMKEVEMSPMDSLIHYNSFLHAGLMAMDPKTGKVKAWVGGIQYEHFKYDHVTAHRQVGSTFKPIIYSAAIASGLDPCGYIPNERNTYAAYKNWSPGNADGKYEGFYSLQGGLVHSVNTVSAAVMMEVGVEQAATFAERFGFQSRLPHDPSLVLGTADLTVQEMVGAYSTFANKGIRQLPAFISRIEDANGQVIAEWPSPKDDAYVMDETTAAMMVHMMQAVVDSGTASRLRWRYGLRGEIAGKTGTTQDQTDGWFMGVRPGLVVGVWVGGDDRKIRFRSLSLGQGANTALPIYGLMMQKLQQDRRYLSLQRQSFSMPGAAALQGMDCPMYAEFGFDPGQSNLMMLLSKLKREAEARKANRQERKAERRQRRQDRWDNFFNRPKGGN